jgi:hypothetical protein
MRGRSGWVLVPFLAIGAYFLLTEHRAHVVPLLPWLLLLACPLLHGLMHRGHGRGHDHGQENRSGQDPPTGSTS